MANQTSALHPISPSRTQDLVRMEPRAAAARPGEIDWDCELSAMRSIRPKCVQITFMPLSLLCTRRLAIVGGLFVGRANHDPRLTTGILRIAE
jgi:hypothetical protein